MPNEGTLTAGELSRWLKVDRLFRQAVARHGPERDVFLEAACGGDLTLRRQVDSLLALDEAELGLFDLTPAWGEGPPAVGAELAREGERIGGYLLGGRLGEGGMSVVFAAERDDGRLPRRVAIKFLRCLVPAGEALARFLAEGRILARLDHPGIARVYDAGSTAAGLPYLVMEHVEGQPIDAFCDARRLGVRERVTLLREVCEAVSYSHRNLIVHRDLKPTNVLVTPAGRPKLLDFGIAKLLGDGRADDPTLTRGAVGPMTPRYASPEQLAGAALTTASDVYSLGLVLYELIAGGLATDAAQEAGTGARARLALPRPSTALARRLAQGARTAVGVDPSDLDGDLDRIVLRSLAAAPEERYASAEQLSDDLGRWLRGYPVSAHEPSWSYRAGRFLKRHRWPATAVATATALLLALTAGLVGAVAELARQRDRARAEEATAEQVTDVLVDLFRIADPDEGRGPTVTARELVDAGAARLARGFAGEPEVEARLHATLAKLYQRLGLPAEARPLAEHALLLRWGRLGEDHPLTLDSRSDLAWLLLDQGEFESALARLDEVLALQRRVLPPGDGGLAETQRRRSEALLRLGSHAAAREAATEALAVARRLDGRGETPAFELLNLLAMAAMRQGDAVRAEAMFREALSEAQASLGPEHPQVLPILKNLAGLLRAAGRLAEAQAIAQEILAAERASFGKEHPRIAFTLDLLGYLCLDGGDLDGAERWFRESLAMRRRLLGASHPAVAVSLAGLAGLHHRRGDLEAAEGLYWESLTIVRRHWPEGSPETAHVKVALGRLLLDRQEARRAEPLLREALAVRRRELPAGAPPVAVVAGALGRCLVALGRYAEAEPLLLEAVAANGGAGEAERAAAQRALDDLHRARGRPAPEAAGEAPGEPRAAGAARGAEERPPGGAGLTAPAA